MRTCRSQYLKSHGLERKTAQNLPCSRFQSKVWTRKAPDLPYLLCLQHVKCKCMFLYVLAFSTTLLCKAARALGFFNWSAFLVIAGPKLPCGQALAFRLLNPSFWPAWYKPVLCGVLHKLVLFLLWKSLFQYKGWFAVMSDLPSLCSTVFLSFPFW